MSGDNIQHSGVRDILQSVKNGTTSRTVAMDELKGLLQANSRRTVSDTAMNPTDAHEDYSNEVPLDNLDKGLVGERQSTISKEDRKALIQKLIDKKRQNKQTSGLPNENHRYAPMFEGSDSMDPLYGSMDHRNLNGFGGNDESVSSVVVSDSRLPLSITNDHVEAWGESLHDRDASQYDGNTSPTSSRSRGTYQPHNQNNYNQNGGVGVNNSMNESYFTRRTTMDDSVMDARASRIAQTEVAIRQEMFKDCTFRPQIKILPSSYGVMKDNEAPFHQRVTKWQKEKDQEAESRKKHVSASDLEDCTFRPKINKNSARAVKEIRGDDNKEDANNRLYKSSAVALATRQKLIEDETQRDQDEMERECSFHPQLIANNTYQQQVHSKFMMPAKSDKAKAVPPADERELKSCTFTPKINRIAPSMGSAKLYVSSNVVDRLTRPIQPQPDAASEDAMRAFDPSSPSSMSVGGSRSGGHYVRNTASVITAGTDRPIMDVASFMGMQQQQHETGSQRPHSAPRSRPGAGTGPTFSAEEAAERKQRFEEFINRQNMTVLRKERKMDEIDRNNEFEFQPELCPFSMKLANDFARGEFLERVDRDLQKRKTSGVHRESIAATDCDFKPKILAKSERLRPRTVGEMSRGDQLKRDNKHRTQKLRCDQEELAEMTFHPQISKKAQVLNKTKLNVEQVTSHHSEQCLKMDAVRKQELKKREEAELTGCTFAPKTRDCPAYVKRIAKSMAIVKASRNEEMVSYESVKPDWR